MNSQDVVRVQKFLVNGGRDLRAKEIASGTNISLDIVEEILKTVVAAGEVIKVGEANFAFYNLVGATAPEAPTPEPYVSRETLWSAEQRARVLAEEKAKQPKPEPRRVITDADIVIPPAPAPLSKSEREFLEVSTKNRRGANPQAFIVK